MLAKVGVRPNGGDGVSVVSHSTAGYARENAGVYGATSSAARVRDASSDSKREDVIVREMLGALVEVDGMPSVNVGEAEGGSDAYGPLLHRWGNAFPRGEALEERLTLSEGAKVGFCGDYTETVGVVKMAGVEAALLSGNMIGKKIAMLENADGQ